MSDDPIFDTPAETPDASTQPARPPRTRKPAAEAVPETPVAEQTVASESPPATEPAAEPAAPVAPPSDAAPTLLGGHAADAGTRVGATLRELKGTPPSRAHRRARRSLRRLQRSLANLEELAGKGNVGEVVGDEIRALLHTFDGRLDRARGPNGLRLRKLRRWGRQLRKKLDRAL